jgi:hypothetical protein
MLDRAETIHEAGYPNGDADRAEFDRLLDDVERMDAARGQGVELPAGDRFPDAPAESTPAVTPRAPVRHDVPATLTGRKRLIAEQVAELERMGGYPEGGILASGSSYTPVALLRFLESCPHGFLDGIQEQLNQAEDEAFFRRQRAEADAERTRRIEQARLTDEEERERQALLDDARRAAETTHEQRVEQLLQDIAAKLEAR